MGANVHTGRVADVLSAPNFKRLHEQIQIGVARCRNDCQYFGVCGGGAPANKYFENGDFASTETLYCRLTNKVIIDLALESIEEDLGL